VKRLAVTPWARVIGGIDIDPAKQAKDLAALTGEPSLRGKPVCADLEALLRRGKPDVIFHTSTSSFRSAWGQLGPMARRGISVVSSCEELIYPRLKEPRLAARLDQVCRKSGARIVGTGVNPGFVMDMLAVCLAMVSSEVRGVRVERVVDAATRRGPLQRKIGSGTAPAEFERLLRAGKAGHAGLAESLALLAHCLGWNGCRITEKGKAVIAAKSIHTSHVQVAKGQT
jgi:4-hydroxy-tetrahydrodipicolinate reductase